MPPDQRAARRVQDVMVPVERLHALDADALATDALATLLGAGDQPVPVVSDQRIVGLVRGSDILKWVMLHQKGAPR